MNKPNFWASFWGAAKEAKTAEEFEGNVLAQVSALEAEKAQLTEQAKTALEDAQSARNQLIEAQKQLAQANAEKTTLQARITELEKMDAATSYASEIKGGSLNPAAQNSQELNFTESDVRILVATGKMSKAEAYQKFGVEV